MSINLPPERTMSQERMFARQHAIVRYARGPAPRRRATQHLARYAALVVGGSALLVGGTAVGYAAFKAPTVPVADETRCYTKASLEGGDHDFFGTTVTQAAMADGSRDDSSAVEACSTLWRQGLLRLDSKQVGGPDTGTENPVPPLAACTLENGVAAVFPGDDGTCAELGLPQLLE